LENPGKKKKFKRRGKKIIEMMEINPDDEES
jgi:hypothetical protein